MIQTVDLSAKEGPVLDDYAAEARFAGIVGDLRAEATRLADRYADRTIWMINSTAHGGGVAEMLWRMVPLFRQLGFQMRWAVLGTEREEFFTLTKRLHNLIHGDAGSGLDLGPDQAALFERVNQENFEALRPQLKRGDLVVVHDPQPLPLGQMVARELGIKTFWRCHIGLDQRTDATRAAWRFLKPYLDGYSHAVFSVPEYIPGFLAGQASIIYPALDPLSDKNRELSAHKQVGILCNSGMQEAHEPVATPDFEHQVKRVMPNGEPRIAGSMGLLFRPIVLEVSRWDRLKGWLPLLEAFVRLKRGLRTGVTGEHVLGEFGNRIELVRLVLAGPDPAFIADDPEGLEVFNDICARYAQLEPEVQEDIAILQLPMNSPRENALIVNALQRFATVVVQNSLREGFGLTVTEAMWKHLAVLGTQACGIRLQVRDRIDGVLTSDPESPDEIAGHLRQMLLDPKERHRMGRSAQRRVYDEFLIFRQISRYLQLFGRYI